MNARQQFTEQSKRDNTVPVEQPSTAYEAAEARWLVMTPAQKVSYVEECMPNLLERIDVWTFIIEQTVQHDSPYRFARGCQDQCIELLSQEAV